MKKATLPRKGMGRRNGKLRRWEYAQKKNAANPKPEGQEKAALTTRGAWRIRTAVPGFADQ